MAGGRIEEFRSGRERMLINNSHWKTVVFSIGFVLIGISEWMPCLLPVIFRDIHGWERTDCMAMEDVAGKTGHDFVILEDNELYQNNLAGISIRGSLPVTIKRCQIYSNGTAGIHSDRHSQVVVADCGVFQNGKAGIDIDDASDLTIENNKIYKNKRAGVRIRRTRDKEERARVLEVKISSNRIYDNDRGGIRSMPQPDSKVDLSIVGNDIYQNKKAGVRVENHTKLTAKGNRIYDNGVAGIISNVSAVPPQLDIYQNRVSFNHGPGIHVVNGITNRIGIRNNWVFNNQRSGILCGLWSDPDIELLDIEIINNTVVSNGSSDEGGGIRNDSKGKAIIMNNIVAYNYVTGIRTKRCQDYSYNLLFANGDVGNCCDDPHSAPYWIERIQFGGCPERGKGDLICDPSFVDPDNYNFYLQDKSPAIDAGKDMHIYNDTSFPPSKGTNINDMGATGGPYAPR
jgi:parallel beta-helix repeat protein